MCFNRTLVFALAAISFARPLSATVTVYEDQAQWNAAVNDDFTSIKFTGLPDWTYVTNQYANLGVTFGHDGADLIRNNAEIFPNDGSGLYGAISSITMQFSAPIYYMAHWYLANSKLELYLGGTLIYTSPTFSPPGSHHFVGFVSTQPFDKARVFSPTGAESTSMTSISSPFPRPARWRCLALRRWHIAAGSGLRDNAETDAAMASVLLPLFE